MMSFVLLNISEGNSDDFFDIGTTPLPSYGMDVNNATNHIIQTIHMFLKLILDRS